MPHFLWNKTKRQTFLSPPPSQNKKTLLPNLWSVQGNNTRVKQRDSGALRWQQHKITLSPHQLGTLNSITFLYKCWSLFTYSLHYIHVFSPYLGQEYDCCVDRQVGAERKKKKKLAFKSLVGLSDVEHWRKWNTGNTAALLIEPVLKKTYQKTWTSRD